MKAPRTEYYNNQRKNGIDLGLKEIANLLKNIPNSEVKGRGYSCNLSHKEICYCLKGQNYEYCLKVINVIGDSVLFQYGYNVNDWHSVEYVKNPIELIATIIEELETTFQTTKETL